MPLNPDEPHGHTTGSLACALRDAYRDCAHSDSEIGRQHIEAQLEAKLDAYLSHYPLESRQLLRIEILNKIKKLEPLLELVLLRFIFEESSEKTVSGHSRN